jgi:hypothetical protein
MIIRDKEIFKEANTIIKNLFGNPWDNPFINANAA